MAEQIPLVVVDHFLMKLLSSDVQEIGFMYGCGKDLKELKQELATINAVLVDAEKQKQEQSHATKDWLRRLKEVVYDAEDLLDDFATHHLQRGGVARQVSNFFSYSNQLAFRSKMGHRLKIIKKQVDEIGKNLPMLELIQGNTTQREAESSRRPTQSFDLTSVIVGRDENKKEIIASLVLSDNQEFLSIVAIVGMGGLGKTTLAQLVYNDKKVVQYFEARIWVCVSENFDVKSLVKKILRAVCEQDVESLELNGLINLFREELSQKRCLLVLDDVWNENSEKWFQLKSLLMVVGKGSKILVTTRQMKVASTMGIDSPFVLEGLKETQAWDFFSKMAFGEEPEKVHPNLVEIGKEIVKMCNGVPLVIKALGGLLWSKTEEHDWLSVKNIKNLLSLGGINDVLSVLKLSYDNLPIHLKRCFAYCALFPKGYEIEKNLLVQLWMAQGYIESLDRNEHLEDIGNRYFEDLLSSSFFEEVREGVNDNIKRYKMHDLMHDLAQSLMGSEVCILTNEEKNIFGGVNHVSLFGVSGPLSLVTKALEAKSLRTFLVFSCHDCKYEPMVNTWISSCKSLRALELKMLEVKMVPECLGKLSHLRYLDLSYNDFMVLPEAITKLKNLQTLKLVHCRNLKEFPKNTRKLINLRHLENEGCINLTYMPFGIGDLTLLQSLCIFVVGNGRGHSRDNKIGSLNELKRLNHLRGELYIKNLENVRDGALETKEENLKGKQYLQSLRLEWGSSEQEAKDSELVMESLQPHPNLEKLYVKGYGGGRFPSWMMNDELYLPSFPCLSKLEITCCDNLTSLPLPPLPCLSKLHISQCSNLASLELRSSPLLSSLDISCCPKLTSLLLLPSPILSLLDISFCDELASLELLSCPLLSSLKLYNCSKLSSLQLPTSPLLSQLMIENCDKLASLELHSSPLLCYLCIKSCPYLTSLKVLSLPCLEVLELYRVREEVWQQLMFVSSSLKSVSIWQLYKTG